VEKNPRRPVYESARFDRLMEVADRVQMRLGWGKEARWERSHLARLAGTLDGASAPSWPSNGTTGGPTSGPTASFRWRAEEDKVGREWWAPPVTPEVSAELEALRRERPGVGEALLFPSPNDSTRPVSVQIARDWLRHAENLADLEALPGGAWHPFRRRWATERKHLSPKDVAAVGGWVDTTTLQKCYQVADEKRWRR
jgi:hypothetical protein